jgi:hypothetical protein
MFLLLRVDGAQFEFVADVLPGLVAVSLGMALTVSPLTATVISAVSPAHTGVASGVNNAISRIAALIAGALVGPLLLRTAEPEAFIAAFRISAGASALVIVAGAVVSAWMMRRHDMEPRAA